MDFSLLPPMLVATSVFSLALTAPPFFGAGRRIGRTDAPLSTIRCSAFFDTDCRLIRTTGPAGGEIDRFVPVHGGMLLTRPGEGMDARLEPVLLDEEVAAPFLAQDGSIKAWLGTAIEGRLAQHGIQDDDSGEQPPGFWLLELSHLPEPPSILDGSWTALKQACVGPGPHKVRQAACCKPKEHVTAPPPVARRGSNPSAVAPGRLWRTRILA